MKRIISTLIFIAFVASSYGQLTAPFGIKIGNYKKTGTSVITIDSIVQLSTNQFQLYKGSTLLNAANVLKVNISDTATMLTHYAKTITVNTSLAGKASLTPDTVQHTANYTVSSSDWGKDQHCLNTTSISIKIPQNLTNWPIGGVINFYGEGAGILVFVKESGVTFISDKDSIATSRKGQAVTIKKIAANKYFLIGPLTD